MNPIKLKPTWSKILLLSPLMGLLVLIGVIIFIRNEPMDTIGYMIAVVYVFLASFVFWSIFLHLPYFTIVIDSGFLTGPSLLGVGWRRVTIPINEIDLPATGTSLDWLGFYVIKSRQGQKITLWGFDENPFGKLTSALSNQSEAH
jgi:hypothetical protein